MLPDFCKFEIILHSAIFVTLAGIQYLLLKGRQWSLAEAADSLFAAINFIAPQCSAEWKWDFSRRSRERYTKESKVLGWSLLGAACVGREFGHSDTRRQWSENIEKTINSSYSTAFKGGETLSKG